MERTLLLVAFLACLHGKYHLKLCMMDNWNIVYSVVYKCSWPKNNRYTQRKAAIPLSRENLKDIYSNSLRDIWFSLSRGEEGKKVLIINWVIYISPLFHLHILHLHNLECTHCCCHKRRQLLLWYIPTHIPPLFYDVRWCNNGSCLENGVSTT